MPQAVDAASRLVRLCTANLTRFQHIKPDNGPEPAPAFTDANGEQSFQTRDRPCVAAAVLPNAQLWQLAFSRATLINS